VIPIAFRRVLPLCAAVLAGVASTTVVPRDVMAAKQAKVPVAVGAFTGPQAAKVRTKVMGVLRKSGAYEITDAEDIKPGASAKTYASMAQVLAANAIVVGVVSKNHNLTLTVYDAKGARVDAVEIKGGGGPAGLIKKVDNELEITLADPIAKATGAGGSKPEPEPKKGKKAEPAGEEEEPELAGEEGESEPPVEGEEGEETSDDSGGESEGDSSGSDAEEPPSEHAQPGLRPLEVTAGFRAYSRSFKYTSIQPNTDTSRTELQKYELPLAPAILATARFYPGALFRNDAWSHIGITARYEFGIATGTQYRQTLPNGQPLITDLTTSSSTWHAGLRGRLPLGTHEVGMFAEYGAHTFILVGDEAFAPPRPYALVPDSKYTFIRTGIDAQFRFGSVILGGHVAPRFMQSVADIDLAGVWFPGATGSGLDAGLMGGYSILSFLGIVGGVDVLRYGFDLNGRPDCPDQPVRCVVAGGATDTYISGWLGVMLHLDGSAKAAAETATVTTE
jgi:hypothetical protein